MPALVLRMLIGLALLLISIAALANHFREQLEGMARGFVERFGIGGMLLGSFLADALHFPIPPQFYMLMGIAGGSGAIPVLAAVCAGSLLGGALGYALAERVGRSPRVASWLARPSRYAASLFERYGYWAPVLATITPIAYSMWCYLAGATRLPRRVFAALSLLRIPKLFVFYYLIRLGWSLY